MKRGRARTTSGEVRRGRYRYRGSEIGKRERGGEREIDRERGREKREIRKKSDVINENI